MIAQRADPFDLDLDDVAGDERTDARGRAGEDHVARQSVITDVMNSMMTAQSKTMSRVLPFCFVSPFTRVTSESAEGSRSVSMHRPERAEGVEALAARELHVLLLQVAGGDVVRAGEAEDDAAPVAARMLRAALPMTMASSPFEVDALRLRRPDDRPVRWQNSARRFQKNDRLGRRLVAELLRVLRVVAADGDDLRRRLVQTHR